MADNRDPNPNRAPDRDPGNPWMKSLFIWAGILLAR
jgi:cell division protease FtsH